MNVKYLLFTCVLLILVSALSAPTVKADKEVIVYFFWGYGCPHCAEEKPFLESLEQKYPEMEVKMFEVWGSQENAQLFTEMCHAYGIQPLGVPATFIGDFEPVIGYRGDEITGKQIEEMVKQCIDEGCIDPMDKLAGQRTCPECPGSTEWSVCVEGVQSRTNYRCSAETGYECSPYAETRPCETQDGKVYIDFFYYCKHAICLEVEGFLDSLSKQYNLVIIKHELSDPKESELFKKFNDVYASNITIIHPTVFIGENYYTSPEEIYKNLESEITNCIKNGCINPREKVESAFGNVTEGNIIELLGLGSIDLSQISLPVFTVIIAGMDGFNPCAFFVLFFLLGMLIYAGSRKRMLLIGGIFVFFSGLIYFLFMSAWLNFFLLVGQIMIITTIAGIVAIAAGVINIKDFFFFKRGVSLVISESKKFDLFRRMRRVLKETSTPSVILATIVLAVAANTYELLCTLGFPMVYTRALTLYSLTLWEYYLYLVLYNLIYVIPLAFIVFLFTLTLGSRKLSEFQGRVLKLLSGSMMLLLGMMLVFSPTLLSNVLVAAGILLTAIVATAVITGITKLRQRGEPINNNDKNEGGDENG